MDQCDDCGEVVCASCSTLLSCKFCGGGLCEECATACGRCGIVLCSRDAKFAVDCDTCRLSYCLVCLASGSKDPCVRCGHRPSKRMEQLVHLRLKSIYKAFKQSSKSPKNSNSNNSNSNTFNTGTSSNTNTNTNLGTGDFHHSHHDHHDSGPTIEELEEGMEDYDPQNMSTNIGNHHHHHHNNNNNNDEGHGTEEGARADARRDFLAEKFLEEKQKQADAAAEALLAELEEEEEAAKSKKSKKKRKKERQQKAKQSDEPDVVEDSKPKATPSKREGVVKKEQTQLDETPIKSRPSEDSSLRNNNSPATPEQQPETLQEATSAEEAMAEENLDPFEKRLYDCVEGCDVDGIEGILFELKGVPGRASLRKNAKKALKRLRAPATSATEAEEEAMTREASGSPSVDYTKGPVELLKLVSDNKIPGKQSSRAECVMQMSPMVVGWVIGKGGQRIRDLMEESGAKVWIDQEKAKPDEARNVYISGERKSVDQAVRMVREIVSKAPIEGAAKYAPDALVPDEDAAEKSSPADNPQEAVARTNSALPGVKAPSPPIPAAEVPPPAMAASNPPILATSTPILSSTPVLPLSYLEKSISEDKFEHVMTCEARFVPLLIGKRGWAIKDIQDKSGARVDIDQTVTPRQIRISGSKASVDKAIPMVRDVLSYPHAQPQPGAEIHDGMEQLLGVAEVLQNYEASPAAAQTETRPHTPPPYSYITTDDAKSAISASSSLSSTPEPSMAPSNTKGMLPQFATGPLIPPHDYNASSGAPMHGQSSSPGAQYLAQDMPGGMNRGAFAPRQMAPPPAMYGGGGLMGMQHLPGMGLPPTHPGQEQMYAQQGPAPASGPMGHHMMHGPSSPAGFGPGGMVPPSPSTKAIHGNHGASQGFGMMGQPAGVHGNSAGPMGMPQQHMHRPPHQAPMGRYNSMPGASLGGGGMMLGQGGGAAFDGRGMNPLGGWDQTHAGRDFTPSPGLAHGSNSGAPPGNLGLGITGSGMMHHPPNGAMAHGVSNSSVPLGGGFDLGQSLGVGGSQSTPFAPAAATGAPVGSIRDDARIIDSLFGQAPTAADPAQSLLSGLNGLSLGGNDGLGSTGAAPSGGGESGLWGSSLPDWNTATEAASNVLESTPTSAAKDSGLESSFLAGLQPFNNLNEDTQQHPPHSRFDWG